MSKMGQSVNHTVLFITSWNHAVLEDKKKLLAALNVLQVKIETYKLQKMGSQLHEQGRSLKMEFGFPFHVPFT